MGIVARESSENSERKGKNYLLMIGVNKYQHLSPLNNCVRDVKNVTEVLTTKYQFEHGDLFFLLDEEATKKNIYKKLLELIDLIQKNDSLIIYFAGHGDFNSTLNECYWIPIEAIPSQIDTYIPMSEFINFISAISAKHILVFSDSSFSYNLIKHGNRISRI